MNILSADVFTRGDNLALDIFRVCSTQLEPVTSPRDITRVETRLCDSLAFEDYDFSSFLNKEALLRTYRISQEAEIPTEIVVDNTSHPELHHRRRSDSLTGSGFSTICYGLSARRK